ncbi:MAG TPA: hypothetical protein VJM34_16425 [Novosphingobium sp.]|nr:hypothetical protein [Novosphingobium sp.]
MTEADELTAAERLFDGYAGLFPPLMRAAHRACREHALLTLPERWPTIKSCLDFAKLYGVSPSELAAFFGYLGYGYNGRTVWVDALDPRVSSHAARQLATREQCIALGFQSAMLEVAQRDAWRAEAVH